MKRLVLGTLATLIAAGALAQGPPGLQPRPALRLGENFTTLFISCGTPVTPECPRRLDPLAEPVLLHYITIGGRGSDVCSGWLAVERSAPTGLLRIELTRIVLGPPSSVDNMVLALPRPIRLEAGDVIALYRAQGTCAVIADLGVELTD